ncbi:hypothetical protein YK56LOC_68460 [Caballeronia sp. HLA56]
MCGNNPHAGEAGMFGFAEEEKKIIPAVKTLQENGMDVTAPLPANMLLYHARGF